MNSTTKPESTSIMERLKMNWSNFNSQKAAQLVSFFDGGFLVAGFFVLIPLIMYCMHPLTEKVLMEDVKHAREIFWLSIASAVLFVSCFMYQVVAVYMLFNGTRKGTDFKEARDMVSFWITFQLIYAAIVIITMSIFHSPHIIMAIAIFRAGMVFSVMRYLNDLDLAVSAVIKHNRFAIVRV